jgi:membrane protease YdiL (CAAX protease family)
VKILLAAFFAEGLLVVASLVLQKIFNLEFSWNANLNSVLLGLALTIPPLAINHMLWGYSQRHTGSIYYRFSHEVIIPLCRHLTWQSAVVVAVLSGACEEIFFRGALHSISLRYLSPTTTCLVTSFLFAATHFLGSFKRYGAMLPLYTAMGAYLWAAYYVSESLMTVAVLHGVYNFIVIMLVKRSLTPAPKPAHE